MDRIWIIDVGGELRGYKRAAKSTWKGMIQGPIWSRYVLEERAGSEANGSKAKGLLRARLYSFGFKGRSVIGCLTLLKPKRRFEYSVHTSGRGKAIVAQEFWNKIFLIRNWGGACVDTIF